jgi:transcriptional regulator with XRE-family HTH domain
MAAPDERVRERLDALGSFIRDQRQKAEMSLRELADKANISNPYLSQVERGLHEPSVRVLTSIASALNLSAETLLRSAGLLDGESDAARRRETEEVIATDPLLRDDQRETLLAVYRNYLEVNAERGES